MASPNNDDIPPSPSGSNANGGNDQNVEKNNFQNNTTKNLKPENLAVNEKLKLFEHKIELQNPNPAILQRGGTLPRNTSSRKSFVPIPVKNEDLDNTNDTNKNRIKELEAEKHTREEKLKEPEEEIEELKVKMYDLENLRNENDINKVKMEKLEAEKHTSEEKLKDLEEQNILLKGKIDEFTKRLAKVDEIEQRTNDLVIGVDHTQTINQRRENTNCDEDDSYGCNERQRKEFEETVESSTAKISEMEKNLMQFKIKDQNAVLRDEVNSLQDKNKELNEINEKLKIKSTTLEVEIEELNKKLKNESKKLETEKENVKEKIEDILVLKGRLDKWKERDKIGKENISELEDKVEKLEEENRRLNTTIRRNRRQSCIDQ